MARGTIIMEELFEKAAKTIKESTGLIALTGAGHSVESGIPDFRSPGGLWDKFDPMEYAHISSFKNNPGMVWEMIFSLRKITDKAEPNAGHKALARLEEIGLLKAVITQNIDNLHQAAGNSRVIEFHGNAKRLECLNCGADYGADEIEIADTPPNCRKCDFILKPSFIFFGEMIPPHSLRESQELAGVADAILVIGTSAVVQPASLLPHMAKQNGACVIEMNLERTALTSSITDIFLQGSIGTTLPKLVSMVENLREP